MRWLICFALILLAACNHPEQGVQGQVLFQGAPLAGAQLEVYLKDGEQRTSTPFTVVQADAEGRYRVSLPAGSYYLVAKLKQQTSSLNRMLMAEAPANPYLVDGGMREIPPFELREMGLDGDFPVDPDTWLSGIVLADGKPVADAFVYLYSEPGDLTGPSFVKSVRTDLQGRYRIALSAGRFWLAGRKRSDGARSGEPTAGDLNGHYAKNPVVVKRADQLQLQPLLLHRVDEVRQRQRLTTGKFSATDTSLSGIAVDEQGNPLRGIYVFAYRDSRMVGKPNFISAPTAADGRFELFLSKGGSYYVGARSAFGGPLEPGEWVGTWDGAPDHGLQVASGEQRSLGKLQLREVW